MIEFHYEVDFQVDNELKFRDWLTRICTSEGFEVSDLNFIFCSDEVLLGMNIKYLEHDNYTDIISFDYTEGMTIAGDIFISVDRLKENAILFGVSFNEELLRVMAHGVLHLIGYKDKSKDESEMMRAKEAEKMQLFHVEQ
ncbi:MAG: rRNA maturation RNase YbeY [Flavobacteriales bacterium]|nr:MAG: rRNA maturation RNase YbeY [Flavobacteriales bacterium]